MRGRFYQVQNSTEIFEMRRQYHEDLLSKQVHQRQQFQQDVREGSRGVTEKSRGEVQESDR